MMKTSLFQKDNRGKIRLWEIRDEDNVLYITYGELGGSMRVITEEIKRGLATRTIEEQVRSRYYSRINDQYKKGYKDTIEEAERSIGTNAMGLKKPMLAQPVNKVKRIDYEHAYIQHKYDGHRCLITNKRGEYIAYSRQGKPITSIGHIMEGIVIPDGVTIDGELYCHGASLQSITSWVKREQPASLNLKYHAYDVISKERFKDRFDRLIEILRYSEHAIPVPTMKVNSEEDVNRHFTESRNQGYEGTIVRWGLQGYESSKRSKHLVKVKAFMDSEFEVIDIHPSKDGWGILECILPNGNTFKVLAPGTQLEKSKVLEYKQEYIGKLITVEFANLTADQIPFHPVALRWREDI